MEALQWSIGILVTIQIPVTGFILSQLWAHVVECRQLMARLEGITKDVERMKEDIGTHDRGLRGAVHKLNSTVGAHQLILDRWERHGK